MSFFLNWPTWRCPTGQNIHYIKRLFSCRGITVGRPALILDSKCAENLLFRASAILMRSGCVHEAGELEASPPQPHCAVQVLNAATKKNEIVRRINMLSDEKGASINKSDYLVPRPNSLKGWTKATAMKKLATATHFGQTITPHDKHEKYRTKS